MSDLDAASVLVVGSGPSGLMAAWRLAERGQNVLLIEAGPLRADRAHSAENGAEIVTPALHAQMQLAARRGFGGTSALWAGRAVPLDTDDFTCRDWVANSGWPIDAGEVAAWYPAACEFLDCGPFEFPVTQTGVAVALERWCAQPNIGAVRLRQILAHPNIRVLSDTVATRIVFDDDALRVVAVDVHSGGQTRTLACRACIVAAGGVETARLLLHSRIDRPNLFGGGDGPLGRYYMGHIYGTIADIVFTEPGGDRAFDYARAPSGHFFRRRFALSPADRRAGRLLNMSAWPEVPAIADARHRSAVLSMGYLALAAPILGPRLAAPAIRARKLTGGDGRIWPHAVNLFRDPFGAARFAFGFGAARYLSRIRKPGFFPLNPARRYSLFHHGEHAPNPDSRVTLGSSRDGHGMLRARIDLRFAAQDAQSIAQGVVALGERLAQSGQARLDYLVPNDRLADAAMAQASDGFHQIGTARMSDDPRFGVVDANARVHGIVNLFVAGSSIFPTSGQANPTLTAVALAARLADHVARALPALPPPSRV